MRYWKSFVVFSLIGIFILIASVARLLIRDAVERRRFLLELVHRMSKVCLTVMGVEITLDGAENIRAGQNYLIAANHMSYLDALLLASIRPMAFVTSVEMRNASGLGLLTQLGGCLYVERRSRDNIRGEIGEIETALREGFHVVIFPEATSTNGSRVLPFKRPLFLAAVHSLRPVLPFVIQYEMIDNQLVTAANRDLLCWYGDMPFGPHIVKMLACHRIRIRIRVLPEIPVAGDSSRDTIAEKAFDDVRNSYQPVT